MSRNFSRKIIDQQAAMQHPCKGCAYLGGDCCNYLLMEGKRRPCPPGDGCTVKSGGDLTKAMARRGINALFVRGITKDTPPEMIRRLAPSLSKVYFSERAAEAYRSGASDPEIAILVGVSKYTVAKWRKLTDRPPQKGGRPRKQNREDETCKIQKGATP